MTKIHTHYDNLKVVRDAPDYIIRAAYKTLSQKYHPDKNPGDDRATRVMKILNQSYEVLSDPVQRNEHDQWIAREEFRLKQKAANDTAHPIPPQWQQRTEPQPPPQPARKSGPNIFIKMLLWPLKIFVAVPQLGLLALLFGGIWVWDAVTPDRPPPPGPKPYQAVAPKGEVKSSAPAYKRPTSAPNGNPWPSTASYVKGYPIDYDDGYSKVTVDNSQNDADVFVKLVAVDTAAFPIRQFFIPSGSTFTMNKVRAGKYDIRYRDLGNGGLSRSELFDVEENHTADGVSFSDITMTLYKVADGNFETFGLAETEF